MKIKDKLPKGWEELKLKEIGKIINGDRGKNYPSRSHYIDAGIPFISAGNIDQNVIDKNNLNYITEQKFDDLNNGKLIKGDLIFCLRGSLGKCAIFNLEKGAISSSLCILRVNNDMNIRFVYYYLSSPFGVGEIIKYDNGTAQPNLSGKNFSNFSIVKPSIETQQAVVSKIEELFSELDKGIEDLKTAQLQLKTYRQSVLKWAFEGKLTNEKVKDGVLPKGWEWTTFEKVCVKIGDIDHKMPKQLETGYPYVSTKDFTNDLKISFDKAKYVSKEDYLNLSRKIKPEKGDIIFPRYGTIGKNILIDFDREFLVSYSCAVVKPNHEVVLSKFIYLFSLSPKITDEIRKYVVETTQANIGIASIKSFVFPLPPMEEQHKVVEILESRLSVADKMEESILESLQQAEALRQSILKKAFSGELI